MNNASTQACIQMHTALAAMTAQPGFGLVANGIVDDEIEFANKGDELVPFEPVIRLGRNAERSTGPQMELVCKEERVHVYAGHFKGYFVDRDRIRHILETPLGSYLPEKDPRNVGGKEGQDRAWNFVRERSVIDLIETIRTSRAVNLVQDPMRPGECGTIGRYGPSFVGELIRKRVTEACAPDDKRLAHILVSAMLLYEITSPGFGFAKKCSDRISQVAAEYANKGYHDGSAMLYERVLKMLIPFRRTEEHEEAQVIIRRKAAAEWFESLMANSDNESFLWRLWRGMRLAWGARDLQFLGNFYDIHARHLIGEDKVGFGAAKARVRRATTEMERLKRAEWDLGDRAENQESWETIGSDLSMAHDLFKASNHAELAAEAEVLSAKAYLIYAEMS